MKKQLSAVLLVVSSFAVVQTSAFAATKATKTTKPVAAATKVKSPLGDISKFRTITADTLAFAKAGDLKKAETRITDMEKKWDAYANALQKKDKARWTQLDVALDRVLKELRAPKPNATTATPTVQDMLTLIDSFS